ncbi:hypothetical protein [Amycolatopsis pithecellobii]|uniref:Uncharacterized protein n=1 Tax=Amycolatopsis pithecellobii TaxID=664692 RepID=A0A6N7Z020_9PSEU|nr:hypothetical protein [Amycolatopsis pithecellobii]MTD54583.1 hypothetical protein [Amycolatopsis pithecellobii]
MGEAPGSARQAPLPIGTAWLSVVRCVMASFVMLLRREVQLPRGNVGRVIRFADGTEARVYRETVADRVPRDPCFLAVSFRLIGVRGQGHALFRWESLLNTPLFIGFPGFVSKLWLAHDSNGTYRGLYEWDGAGAAERYARSLWRVLELVCVRGSIDYRVVPGVRRDDMLAGPDALTGHAQPGERAWWRVGGTR